MQVISPGTRTMPPDPFSMALRYGKPAYLSGQVAYDGDEGEPVKGGIEARTRQTPNNLRNLLQAAARSRDGIVKLTCIWPNFPTDHVGFNRVFQAFFPGRITRHEPPSRPACSGIL